MPMRWEAATDEGKTSDNFHLRHVKLHQRKDVEEDVKETLGGAQSGPVNHGRK